MKKSLLICMVCVVFVMVFAGVASAHVSVLPNESTQGASEKFTVRVPNEEDNPTVKVEVKFPINDVTISRFESKPEWTYTVTKDASDKITSVIWTATGNGIKAGEFAEFNMQGKIGEKATTVSWKAYQTYKDGTVVEWVGAEGSGKPAAVTKVKEKSANASTDNNNASQLPLYLSIAALVVGIASLFISIGKKAK